MIQETLRVGAEALQWAVSFVRRALFDAARGILPPLLSTARRWIGVGLDIMLDFLTGRSSSAWRGYPPTELSASLEAAQTTWSDALVTALHRLMHNNTFLQAVADDLQYIQDQIRPPAVQKMNDIAVCPIPPDEPLHIWAARMGKKYNMTATEVILFRHAANTR